MTFSSVRHISRKFHVYAWMDDMWHKKGVFKLLNQIDMCF